MTSYLSYDAYKALVDTYLTELLPLPDPAWQDAQIPASLVEAMRYSLLAGGKRLRPVLMLAGYHINQPDLTPALPFAAAIEMIHTYSLIHDDLPAMDNDDLRRGLPTSHRKFGEATAILAGDALLTMAFSLMAESGHEHALPVIAEIAKRAGPFGMVAGQMADLAANDQPDVHYIHLHKTADLLTAPLVAGLMLSGASDTVLDAARTYGYHLGLAFQIVDDLLDIRGDQAVMGKETGKDADKRTWPQVYGLDQAERDARAHATLAEQAALGMGVDVTFFLSLARQAVQRVQ